MWPAVPTMSIRTSALALLTLAEAGTVAAALGGALFFAPIVFRPRDRARRLPIVARPIRAAGPARIGRTARPADRVQNLRQPEIDLPPLEIHADDLHAHSIAETIDASVLLAAQNVRALDEPVVVVGHRGHVHHALDEVLDQLEVEAEGADAGDVAVELVADLVGHEAHFLPLHQLALRVVRAALALRRVARNLRHVLGQLRAAILRDGTP